MSGYNYNSNPGYYYWMRFARIEDGKVTGCWWLYIRSAKASIGDEIMNVSMGIRKCICQNKNLVRVVNKVIGNIATPLPKQGSFCLIKHYRTISLISIQ